MHARAGRSVLAIAAGFVVASLVRAQSDPDAAEHLPIRAATTRPVTEGARAERAILEGLRWLARHQDDDGSWTAAGCARRCDANAPCFDARETWLPIYDEGVTGLALLAFLDAGYTNESKQALFDVVRGTRVKVGDVVKNGLSWLAKRQAADGHFTCGKAFLYDEAIATAAMVEAYRRTQNRYWKDPAQKGVEFLERAQRPSPDGKGAWGWRYLAREDVGVNESDPRTLFDADTSVTSWCASALARARAAGLVVKRESLDGALAFTRWATADNGLVGYVDPKGAGATVTGRDDHFRYHPSTMSALGICLRLATANEPDDPFLELAAKQIAADLPTVSADGLTVDYYNWNAGTRALRGVDGPDGTRASNKHWGPWKRALVESLVALQDTSEKACRRGGWTKRDRWSHTAGPLYATAMNVLTLEQLFPGERSEWWKDETPRALVGEEAPVLDLHDARLAPITTESLRGRIVMLDFWSPYQATYAADLAAREALAKRLAGKRFTLVGVGLRKYGSGQEYLDAVDRHLGSWDTVVRTRYSDELFDRYDVRRFPTVVVIDASGIIRLREAEWDASVAKVEALLDALPPVPSPK